LPSTKSLVDGVLHGDRRAIAKAITVIENDLMEAQRLISMLYAHTGKAHIIGVTGPGGAGKSTLIGKIANELRRRGKTLGVVAVDPTSPFSGGAFLGDRIRMQDLSTDEGVFIRSMAIRNNPGGLARATKDAIRILDASGKDVILIETVGAGQSEVDVAKIAQTIVVVLAPDFGDEIQAIKAGLMEIGDIFVINKADRQNANRAVTAIEAMLELSSKGPSWKPFVIKTMALRGEGVLQLLNKIKEHREYLTEDKSHSRQRRIIEAELTEAIKRKTVDKFLESMRKSGRLDSIVTKILAREINPFTAAERIVSEQLKRLESEGN